MLTYGVVCVGVGLGWVGLGWVHLDCWLLLHVQVEVETGQFVPTFTDGVLIHRKLIEDLNAEIKVRTLSEGEETRGEGGGEGRRERSLSHPLSFILPHGWSHTGPRQGQAGHHEGVQGVQEGHPHA